MSGPHDASPEATAHAAPRAAAEAAELRLRALPGIPEVAPGDDLCALVLGGLQACGEQLHDGDVLVLAQKIVSKAEGRLVDLATVQPSDEALALAARSGKDPRLVELTLRESTEVLRCRPGVIVVEHRTGFVMANAGIDQSNVRQRGEGMALLLPLDPDASCATLRARLHAATGADVAVLIIDSHGRAWRQGTVGVAIGAAGMPALLDLRGHPDRHGRALQITQVGLADELAAAASLLMGQAQEGRPVVLARGVPGVPGAGCAADLVRPREIDLFR
jgi:coenzyme F420-0:L-glutamate ligase / coenzyme F420-1:gamma-L-glutamate ligase